ncbi:cytochrome P450 [Schizopora paradoxa]|uniref:Cytochrome P450 n=1 Tax=Schizopora paradoxa TaxID=27342 RepID=A0A0H2REH8_9AGAM|nr:cytochrome P450 [Schizopora paradoxa]
MLSIAEVTTSLVALGTCFFLWSLFGTSRRRLPPGPGSLPVLGNIRDFPPAGELEGPHWAKHKALYGPISSLQAFGKTFMIVNDIQTAVDLLDKRSSIYSERPISVFGGEMCGFGEAVSILCTTDKWRNDRKRIHTYIGTRSAVSRFNHLIELEARRLALRLVNFPNTFVDQLKAFTGSTILKLTFGYCAAPDGNDPLVAMGNTASSIFVQSVNNLWAVDVFPFLKYFPSWLPGMGFKGVAEIYHKMVTKYLESPFEFLKSEMANGTAIECFIGHELEVCSSAAEEYEIKWLGAALYGAGSDTTVAALETFLFAMTLNPAIFRRLQNEIDSVIGQDRLPLLTDMPNLTYLEAVLKETLRWNAILPLGLPHVSLEDDSYDGYFIPKGSIVIPNIWQMCNDPLHYPEPSIFNPDRFLSLNDREPAYDPSDLIFGFGRRICPGKDFANASTSIAMAMIAAVFDVSKAEDELGKEVEIQPEFTTANGLSHPKSFRCSILPRSENAAELIQSVLIDHPYDRDDSKKIRT